MEDSEIIAMFHRREEQAIWETERKYSSLCRRIAMNILSILEDAEECVSDTWYAAWNTMPPERPGVLGAFLGRITRNLSISRFRSNRAQKRYSGMEVLLSELDDCVPSPENVEERVERQLLTQTVNRWLDSLPAAERTLFVRRYWYGDRVKELAQLWGCTQNQMSQRLMGLRKKLKGYLQTEGVEV